MTTKRQVFSFLVSLPIQPGRLNFIPSNMRCLV